MGFSLSQHYCLGMLVEEHLYHDGSSCEIEMLADDSCHNDDHNQEQICSSMNGCCKDVWIQVDQVQIVSLLDAPTSIALASFEEATSALAFRMPFNLSDEGTQNIRFKPPPLHPKGNTQYLVDIQRFLI